LEIKDLKCTKFLILIKLTQGDCMESHEISVVVRKPLIIMIAGPYMSGTGGDPEKIAANRQVLEAQCLPIWNKGHLPIIGEWLALPIIHSVGGKVHGDDVFVAYQYPVAHRLLERCDAVYRLPGASQGADKDVARAEELGLAVYFDLAKIPDLGQKANH
jgi:hypothetical protein